MTSRIQSVEQMRTFLEGTAEVEFKPVRRAERQAWIAQTLAQAAFWRLRKKDRGVVRRYLCRITGYSRQQMTRLLRQYRETGAVLDRRKGPAKPFARRYTDGDIALLAEVDEVHDTLSGPATAKLCEREFEVHGRARFERLARISAAHVYNLRRSLGYRRQRGVVTKTRPTQIMIGERRAPCPEGRPGFLRVDSVHFGDWDGVKGLYLINAVDEVTQMQFMAAVPRLAEQFVAPVVEEMLAAFPYPILGFHTDNGSEYVNYALGDLLRTLLVDFTKSRPRRSNDNALVESKNGTVVRKYLGHAHIPASAAPQVNAFLRESLTPYVNFHRPSYFPTVAVDEKGRQRKSYPAQGVTTPYEKLKSLPNASASLKPGMSWESLEVQAKRLSGHEAGRSMHQARDQLFLTLSRRTRTA